MSLAVLYRDEHLIAIDKPSGWLVHRSNIDRHETRILVQALRDQIGQHVYPVHRLDKGTSGILLFALDPTTAKSMVAQFEQARVHKHYLAVVRGWPSPSGRIEHALSHEYDSYEDASEQREAQDAVTEYRRLATVELAFPVDRYPTARYALVALTPHTGRRHQLRRHMKHIAHPIIGDATHGKGRHNRYFQQQYNCHRLLLACTGLQFQHPLSAEEIRLGRGVGDSFAAVLESLAWLDDFSPAGQGLIL